ncbi:unnamed protein product (macronuclear) [Paramecium tetraurelia]|uniref:Uncharacterized protein n=1 Tax=Paramecium tetraurelia TaxID=5888 RepID=A0D131_PARTE|nr:uncharacterized protein GSPATT00039163001 [Paramecium tetraurelia]CAK76748.1 unnamed protein product [Paramecium tetraurelia]|eukprot:XP_001444145.1 hypothetical protein (macronuclear) [Paramecium tetraurelia strain d4-2]
MQKDDNKYSKFSRNLKIYLIQTKLHQQLDVCRLTFDTSQSQSKRLLKIFLYILGTLIQQSMLNPNDYQQEEKDKGVTNISTNLHPIDINNYDYKSLNCEFDKILQFSNTLRLQLLTRVSY